ncbi:MAG: phosphoenolpyruvate carboxylase [Rickettsiales bacterium]|nr:phosphoenolpyruvate carboxylase [Rickettsiales bacterium]
MAVNLQTTDGKQLEHGLQDMLIDTIRQHKGDVVADTVRDIAGLIRDHQSEPGPSKDVGTRVQQMIESKHLEPEQRFDVVEMLSLLNHMSRSAKIKSARNHSDANPDQQEINHLIDALAQDNMTPDQMVDHFKGVAMDNVFTAHPTYIGDLSYMKQLRAFDLAVHKGNETQAKAALEELMGMNSLVANRLTAQDETAFMRHALKNTYRSIPFVYEHFDEAMARNKRTAAANYDPLSLKLDLAFRSWGSSGDKDGNKNITFQSLRDAIYTHRETVINAYMDDLNDLRAALPEKRWNAQYENEFNSIVESLQTIHANPANAESQQAITFAIDGIRHFTRDICNDAACKGKAAQAALGLYRKVNTFGMHLGTIEFRETADELEFVLNHVVDGAMIDGALGKGASNGRAYSQLDQGEKDKVLSNLLDQAEHSTDGHLPFADKLAAAMAQVPSDAKTRRFGYADSGNKADGTPDTNNGIFYHTIKRLQLAADNPDLFNGQALAEAETAVQMKEMLMLLKLTGNDKNIRIVPLFEDPEVLANLDSIMVELLHDKHVFRHQLEVSLSEWGKRVEKADGKDVGLRRSIPEEYQQRILALPDLLDQPNGAEAVSKAIDDIDKDLNETMRERFVQENPDKSENQCPPIHIRDMLATQVQLAHSDNSRRGGMAGARAGLYKAHSVIRDAAHQLGIGAQLYEGGSHTDSFRMGVRSYRSLVNMYDNHKFMKATVQGMDLAQIFSNPATIESFIEENIANSALRTRERTTGSKLMSTRKEEELIERKLMDPPHMADKIIECVSGYQQEYFGSKENPNVVLGNIMAQVFKYQENNQSGTIGSRSGGRGKVKDQSMYLNPVTDTRTIGYSETFQHGRLNPNFIGAGRLGELIKSSWEQELSNSGPAGAYKSRIAQTPDEEKLHAIYTNSPVVRDSIDRTAYAVATTDFDKVWDNAMFDNDKPSAKRMLDRIDTHASALETSEDHQEFRDEAASEIDQLRGGLDAAKGKANAEQFTRQRREIVIGTADEIKAGTPRDHQVISKRPSPDELEALAADKDSSAAGFLAWMELEYRSAAKTVLEAIKPEEAVVNHLDELSTAELANKVRDALPMYKDLMQRQDVMMEAADAISNGISKEERGRSYGEVHNGLNKALHNLRDVVTLARPPFRAEMRHQGIIQAQAAAQSQAASVA